MRGVSNDVPWRGTGDVIRTRFSGNGKGDQRRPTDAKHIIPCNGTHLFLGSKTCWRCGIPVEKAPSPQENC